MSSSSRYRDIMTMNQWLDNQESWREALPRGKKRVGNSGKTFFFVLSVCKKFWLREHDMMDFILCEPRREASCGSARETWGCWPWHRQLAFQQNIF